MNWLPDFHSLYDYKNEDRMSLLSHAPAAAASSSIDCCTFSSRLLVILSILHFNSLLIIMARYRRSFMPHRVRTFLQHRFLSGDARRVDDGRRPFRTVIPAAVVSVSQTDEPAPVHVQAKVPAIHDKVLVASQRINGHVHHDSEESGFDNSDSASDTDDEMPEPVATDCEVKLITLNQKTSLAVIDSESFRSASSHISLISGAVQLQLVHGNINLNGYELKEGQSVDACVGSSKDFVIIHGDPEFKSNAKNLAAKVKKYVPPQFASEVLQEMVSFKNYPNLSIIKISEWADHRIQFMQAHLMNRMHGPHNVPKRSFFNLAVCSNNRSSIGEDWMPLVQHNILKTINDKTVLLVTGKSDSGKSHLLKRIVNRIMSEESHFGLTDRIIYVDLDPGQSEFAPPGQVTAVEIRLKDAKPLISKPSVHSILYGDSIIAGVSVGAIDIASSANVYVDGVMHLYSKVQEELAKQSCPVFINTCGFVQGIGRSILIDLIRTIQPTNVIEIKESLDLSNDCKFDVIFGPRAIGFTTDFRNFQNVTQYSYMDLKSTGSGESKKGANARNREAQILSCLTKNPEMMAFPLKQLVRTAVDIKDVIHFSSPVGFADAILDKLHMAFVQLIQIPDDLASENRKRGICLTRDLGANLVVGYGVLFVTRTDSGQVRLEVASTELKTPVNCIVIPKGVSLPHNILS